MSKISQSRRTTSHLVKTAIEGAQNAGLDVSVVEVCGGGVVRIVVSEVTSTGISSEAKTCDDIFEERSG